MITKAEQRLLAKYGTTKPEEIVSLKSGGSQSKLVPSRSHVVRLTPEECKAKCDAAGIEYLEGYENRVIRYTLSDETVDRDGDIMIQAGADLENFRKNPVSILFHDSRQFPIGNFIDLSVDAYSKELKGDLLFVDDRVDTSGQSERAFRFAKSRIMRAGSIGFQGKEVKFPTTEERKLLGMKDYGVIFLKWELYEFSLCPVPSNPNALSDALRKGVLKAEDLQYIDSPQHEVLDMTREEVDALIADGVKKAMGELAPIEKAGRTISRKTMERLKRMHERATEACTEIKALIDEHEPADEEEEGDKPNPNPNPDQDDEEKKAAEAQAKKDAEEAELKALADSLGEFSKELQGTAK